MYHYDDTIRVQLGIDCAYNKWPEIVFSSQYGEGIKCYQDIYHQELPKPILTTSL